MATHLCGGRIVFALEGGYQPDVLAYGVLNAFYALMGEATIVDPLGPSPHTEHPVEVLVTSLKRLHHLD